MPRCDYDIIFYRVFCITLLGIAFTFTVILTNVFVDIDGLLYNEQKAKDPKPTTITTTILIPTTLDNQQTINQNINDQVNAEILATMDHFDKQYEDDNDNNLDRSKRSLDKQTFKIHVKNPKVKMLLSKQLSSLLEELEEEEASTVLDTTTSESSYTHVNSNTDKRLKEIDKIEKEGVLHLAMHNILLKGIINHMDLNDIYKTINDLSNTEIKNTVKLESKKPGLDQQLADAENIENKFLEELANCSTLRKEVKMFATTRMNKNNSKINTNNKGPKVIINTLIDIKSVNNIPEKEQKKQNKENVVGVVKLLYNGKSVKFIDANQEIQNLTDDNMLNTANIFKDSGIYTQDNSDSNYKSPVDDYVSKFYKKESNIYPQLNEFLEKRRSKRNADIKSLSHHKKGHNKNSNEFYVEIETRFDKKDMDGNKKKQFVKELIKKIQKAIRTKEDPQKLSQKLIQQNSKHRIVQFKKRILSPLEDTLIKKLGVQADHVVHRHLDPISKIVPIREHFGPDRIASNSRNAWKDVHEFPSFLSKAKSINSAEIGEVNVEYDKANDGVPQRLQLPLNTNNINDVLEGQQIDVGDIKLSIKDLDGSGLAIGFNQYLPESENFVVYDGLENIFEHFPENYEQGDKKSGGIMPEGVNDEYAKTMVNFHDIIKRSAQFDHLDRDLSQDKDMNTEMMGMYALPRAQNFSLTTLLGMGVFEKQKKSLTVPKFFNHRNKIKVKQYLNTNSMNSKHKKYVLRKLPPININRRKRDLSSIRILTDILPGDVLVTPERSQENVFIVSDENIFDQNPAEMRRPKFADRTATYNKVALEQYDTLPTPDDFVYREVKMPEHHEGNADLLHQQNQDHRHEQNRQLNRERPLQQQQEPDQHQIYLHEKMPEHDHGPEMSIYDIPSDLSKNNPALSNYPHIVADKNDDNSIPNIIFGPQEIMGPVEEKKNEIEAPIHIEPTQIKLPDNVDRSPDLEELTNAIAPKTSYKVTVKLLPKNESGDGTGVKEVFTTINKTFNKNGRIYSRLVNVSEIAKIQSLNETVEQEASDKEQQQKHDNIILNNKLKKSEKDLKDLKEQRQMLKDIIDKHTDNTNIIMDQRSQPTKKNYEKKTKTYDFLPVAPIPARSRNHFNKKNSLSLFPTSNPNRMPKNENPKLEIKMTNAILAKIEENTNALKTFLQRLNKLEENPKRQSPFPGTPHNFMPLPGPPALHPPFSLPTVPNVDTHRNGSFIPFVYAFQHPLPQTSPNQTEHDMSVIYHGHIHTKTGPKVKHFDLNKLTNTKHSKRNALRSRFFLDDVGTVIGTPMNVFKYKNYIKNPKIKINSTILI